ncbi:Uncharacterized protein APZ42_027821 [Daphnia magna]|uniref:Uncharacterized protein n=1 Tax=Daphnia magna TaxID=35525 RepID=A0A164R1N0_9CRUS|nr:Uncharacterized protein APZ42_027821 [Daphnia magna]
MRRKTERQKFGIFKWFFLSLVRTGETTEEAAGVNIRRRGNTYKIRRFSPM